MKKRIVVVGAGLCGSVLSALLRNHFHITVIEQGKRKQPLYNDVICEQGDVNTSINRAEGLGGTTNYWHNALIELTNSDLQNAGIDPPLFESYYAKAWLLFLSEQEKRDFDRHRDANDTATEKESWTIAHMVVPYARSNVWMLANARYPGDAVSVIFGTVKKIVPGEGGDPGHALVKGNNGITRVDADYFLICAGGLATPVLISNSVGREDCFCDGYHDHPMAYIAKIKLKPESRLKILSCKKTTSADIRSGFVFETDGLKTVFYLRPAMNMSLKSICGSERYILSDLRNSPFSPTKIFRLLTNLDAIKEAILFKTKAGFHGDYYSILMLGEQSPGPSRGIAVNRGNAPTLNWHVKPEEHGAYRKCFDCFMMEFSSEIVESNVIPTDKWEYRTAAHHSGSARAFISEAEKLDLSFFAVKGLRNSFVCDASILRAGGIANSGLTLVALSHLLAELAIAEL
jgi:hypothetical protein